jgi:hypothetical protein
MIRCHWCGAQNYAIDSWCARCSRHLDFAPPKAVPDPPVVPTPQAAALKPRRRSRPRGLIPRALAVAAVAIAIALAMPVASWFGAAGPLSSPGLPNTAVRPSAPTPSASSVAPTQPAPTPDATPSPEATPTPVSAAPPDDNSSPDSGPVPPAAAAAGNPAAVVARFYQAVSGHDFAMAAALWTPRMQAEFPPTEYIDHRFAATQAIHLRADRALGDGGGQALVYVDVVEVIGGQTRHWVGTWQLVDTASGWLLNRPNLRAA